MQDRIRFNLSGVPETLLLPLWGRAKNSLSAHPVLRDPKAVEIAQSLDVDFSRIEKQISAYSNLFWARRTLLFDQVVRTFLQRHPQGIVVNLGAGLDTSFYRVDNGSVRWIDLDLEPVIAVRRRLLPEGERNRMITSSLFDLAWVEKLPIPRDNVLLLCSGVLFYFEKPQLEALFKGLVRVLPGAEMLFDVQSNFGVFSTNLYLRRSGFLKTPLRWAVKDPAELRAWVKDIEVLEVLPLFAGLDRDPSFTRGLRLMIYLNDRFRIGQIFHLRLGRK